MSTAPANVFFSVGEPSGDLHGANLIRAMRAEDPEIQISGFGGPRMQAAGMNQLADLTQFAVMWIVQAVVNLDKFWRLLRQADRYFQEHHPSAVVLIDYPGFNWWIARAAKKHRIPVYYYGAPQIWAWGGWRIGKMRRLVDEVLCKLPFEADWYRQQNCQAQFVGHPYFDQLINQQLDRDFIQRHGTRHPHRLVSILPGSRTQEVRHNLPWLLKAAAAVHDQVPDVRFAIASFDESQAQIARGMLAEFNLPIEVHVGRTSELLQISHSAMACSGSVSLELMYYTCPSVILYWLPRTTYWLGSHLVRVKYMTLVNLLACADRFDRQSAPYDAQAPGAAQVPFPEYPTHQDKSADLAQHIVRWLRDPVEYQRRREQLTSLKSLFCVPGASHTAANYLLTKLDTLASDRPHASGKRAA